MSPHIYHSDIKKGYLAKKTIHGITHQKWFFISNYPTEQDCIASAERWLQRLLEKHAVPQNQRHRDSAGIKKIVKRKRYKSKNGEMKVYHTPGFVVTGGIVKGRRQTKFIAITDKRPEKEAEEMAVRQRIQFILEMGEA